MNIICPLCQTTINSINCPECKKVRVKFKNTVDYSPAFSCHYSGGKVNYYQINIVIDGQLYGYDSYQTIESHTDILFSDSNGLLMLLKRFDGFTQIPESREDIERAIKRVLNLKAFL
jgi:hypothetical protein